MFQILDFTEAHLATVTTRVEKHGDDDKPAVSLGLEITTGNAILDLIDPMLRPTFYKTSDTKALPGIDDALTVLRCNSVERVLLPTKHEGWTLAIDDGIDETKPMIFGGVKCDKFSVEPQQGGSVVLRLRVGTSDLDAARSGMLGMHVGRPIWVTLIAPKPGDEKALPTKGKAPDATDLFAGGDGDEDDDDDGPQDLEERLDGALDAADDDTLEGRVARGEPAWPFPNRPNNSLEAPPQAVTVETSRPGTRTARGREQTKAALTAGAHASKSPAKYRDARTGETWSGRGLQPKWLKVALSNGKSLSDFTV
jgi:hypothetical protein